MRYPTKRKSQQHRGLTLIELIVVVAVIGLLASLILFNVSNGRIKARDARRISDIKQLQEALDLFASEHGFKYPSKLNCLVPNYLTSVPTDPSGNTSYSYAGVPSGICDCSGGAPDFHLGASLEQANNSVLQNDADSAGNAGVCTGSTNDFPGADSGKCNGADTGVACYDIYN